MLPPSLNPILHMPHVQIHIILLDLFLFIILLFKSYTRLPPDLRQAQTLNGFRIGCRHHFS